MHIKKMFIGALVALCSALNVNAQGGFGDFDPEKMADMSVHRMDEQLNLNEEQEGKIKTIYLDMFKGGFENMSGPEEMKKKFEDMNKKIKAVLNDEQKAKYDKMMEEMRRRGPGGPR